jgi:glycine/D-amino acid oxidase-like deaminating enzyme
LRRTCLDLGVRIAESTPVRRLESGRSGRSGIVVHHRDGAVTADRVALATNVFPALLRRYRWHTVPVWDYALMTQPLQAPQWEDIGWRGREGLADSGNQFHYYRRTRDDRILFGGYDAVYYFGRSLDRRLETSQASFRTLAEHFFTTFPQLRGRAGFSHAWGGAIDTCTRFFPFFGTGHGGRVAHVAGFTGLGVGSTRFAAQVLLDLLAGTASERTDLDFVRRRPIPFPPEPFAWVGIRLTTASLQRADRHQGRRNAWLRALDGLGLGFDS